MSPELDWTNEEIRELETRLTGLYADGMPVKVRGAGLEVIGRANVCGRFAVVLIPQDPEQPRKALLRPFATASIEVAVR